MPFSSPTSPNPFFSNSSAVSINDIAATAAVAATSVENASSAVGPDGSEPAGAGTGGGGGGGFLRGGERGYRRLSGGEEELVDGTSSLAGTVTPGRPPRVSSETAAVPGEGTPPAAPSPGISSVASAAGDGVEALLLVSERNIVLFTLRSSGGTQYTAVVKPPRAYGWVLTVVEYCCRHRLCYCMLIRGEIMLSR